MIEVIFTIPIMWADHHVLAVRRVLGALPNVTSISASAMNREVSFSFDPAATSAEAIATVLADAGYEAGDLPACGPVPSKKEAWNSCGYRNTVTNYNDLAMSGDHRKY